MLIAQPDLNKSRPVEARDDYGGFFHPVAHSTPIDLANRRQQLAARKRLWQDPAHAELARRIGG